MTPQTTKNKENLKCYHCDPMEGNTGIKLKCLQDEDELGELKQCPLSEQLCARGKIGKHWLIRKATVFML